jgi:phytoene synthase
MSSRPRRRSAIADILDPERRLALSYIGKSQRGPLELLWRLDASFAQLLGGSTQPLAAQLKLAWWREALTALDGAPAPAEPMLQEIKCGLLPAGLSGRELADLADGWEQLLAHESLSPADLLAYGSGRGGGLFGLSARLLGSEPIAGLGEAGVGWALVDLARHSSRTDEAQAALQAAALHLAGAPRRWPRALRPLGMLTMLAQRDAATSGDLPKMGSPGRILRMFAHRLTGR